jgi:molybdopterin-containing oxidoreductase family iron-sulfur binding subunit
MAKSNEYAVGQPTIRPLHNTASALESLLVWNSSAARGGQDSAVAYDYIKATFAAMNPTGDFNYLTHNSCIALSSAPAALAFSAAPVKDLPKSADTEVVFYQKAAIGNGDFANNPWLQEMPDPVSKVTWDNYAAINPIFAKELGLTENSMVTIKSANNTVTLPVLMQPGQAMGTVSAAIGYGRTAAGKAGSNVGVNIYPFLSIVNGTFQNYNSSIELVKAEGSYELAQTQTHHTIEGRDIIKEKTLAAYAGHEPAAEGEHHASGEHAESKGEHHADLCLYWLWRLRCSM